MHTTESPQREQQGRNNHRSPTHETMGSCNTTPTHSQQITCLINTPKTHHKKYWSCNRSTNVYLCIHSCKIIRFAKNFAKISKLAKTYKVPNSIQKDSRVHKCFFHVSCHKERHWSYKHGQNCHKNAMNYSCILVGTKITKSLSCAKYIIRK